MECTPTYGLPAVVIRPFNSMGRGSRNAAIWPKSFRVSSSASERLAANHLWHFANSRDFTYVVESANGIAMMADCDGAIGRTVNMAYGRGVTINQVAETVARLCRRPDLGPHYIEPRPGDVRALQADTRLARELFGRFPRRGRLRPRYAALPQVPQSAQ